jgi:hypothetical protein
MMTAKERQSLFDDLESALSFLRCARIATVRDNERYAKLGLVIQDVRDLADKLKKEKVSSPA